MERLSLQPFGWGDLPLVEPWFRDADTRRWLGGPRWPRQVLERSQRPLTEYRGARETGRYRWLAREGSRAIGYIDCGTYDHWTTWEGGADGRGVVGTINVPSGALAYVVAPRWRRQGYGTAMILAVMARPELTDVTLFGAGVEPGNAASVGCLRNAGFQALDPEPDWEGIVYYVRFRWPAGPPAHRMSR